MKRLTTIEKTIAVLVIVILGFLLFTGCVSVDGVTKDNASTWEVLCYAETGQRLFADTLEGKITQGTNGLNYFAPSDKGGIHIRTPDAMYTGNCRARKIEKVEVF